MSSHDLEHNVREEIHWTPLLADAAIAVTATGASVGLSGKVASLAAREAARRIAAAVPGVEAVVDDLVVEVAAGALREDRDLRKAVRRVLEWNALVPPDRLEVEVDEGVVTLTGEVDWPYQKEAALAAVTPLLGIRDLVDAVTVQQTAAAEQVETSIRRALHRNAEIDAERVHVAVEGGRVVLRGMVRTSAEIEAVEAAAWAAPGVAEVESHLRSEEELASV